MATRDPALKLTYEDLELWPDDGKRHEIIDGDHYVTPSPMLRHQDVAGRLYSKILNFLDDHPLGWVYIAPADVVLSPQNVVVPDLLFVARERHPILTPKNLQGAPD